ncbi:predicted protein [Aspergillus nidulans FGSC A4]|uniref:Uncharacterized protein n=1 Tax=Emericella nidulans (strain FGSC A4 / ATCC 38163 / CBS 112.46 / NRRL 194 / M139) TaxID=227321 RepID=Q5AZ05_EMENI|nr:hypothetical protein [Aspergillus nidulans FGSC A4]EAA58497.1 predicted protein [Aspergillus nidulans FGSC A4]CBF69387.1 TPA: hypothetical protein ANIA_06475 [Aspergillus nidulans FGSC A4]|eukprot:XP_664079.1 predicted protein [Aspergillus nidulans FGSC A4]
MGHWRVTFGGFWLRVLSVDEARRFSMPSIRDNNLRKSPEYCHYLEAVKDRELMLPDFKIGCLKYTVPSANRNILVKYLKDKNSYGMEFTLHNGPPTIKELMEAKGKSYLDYLKHKQAATKSKDHNTKGVKNFNEGEAGNDQDNGKGLSSGPSAMRVARQLNQLVRKELYPTRPVATQRAKAKGANMDNAKETSNKESILNKENKYKNKEEKAAEPEEVQGDDRYISEYLLQLTWISETLALI